MSQTGRLEKVERQLKQLTSQIYGKIVNSGAEVIARVRRFYDSSGNYLTADFNGNDRSITVKGNATLDQDLSKTAKPYFDSVILAESETSYLSAVNNANKITVTAAESGNDPEVWYGSAWSTRLTYHIDPGDIPS